MFELSGQLANIGLRALRALEVADDMDKYNRWPVGVNKFYFSK